MEDVGPGGLDLILAASACRMLPYRQFEKIGDSLTLKLVKVERSESGPSAKFVLPGHAQSQNRARSFKYVTVRSAHTPPPAIPGRTVVERGLHAHSGDRT